MKRLKRAFSRRPQPHSNPSTEESEVESKTPGRSFENPHRCSGFVRAEPIYSEFTPGLGRRVPELLEAGAGFFEIHYKNNYERRLDWAYSPDSLPVYKKMKYHYKETYCYVEYEGFSFDAEYMKSRSSKSHAKSVRKGHCSSEATKKDLKNGK